MVIKGYSTFPKLQGWNLIIKQFHVILGTALFIVAVIFVISYMEYAQYFISLVSSYSFHNGFLILVVYKLFKNLISFTIMIWKWLYIFFSLFDN